MHEQKLTKSISVSNFDSKQLDCVLETAKVKPVVNQLPYSVAYHPGNVIAENNKRDILVQAWAPLGGSLGGRFDKNVKSACAKIGKNHGNKSFAQVGSSGNIFNSAFPCGTRVFLSFSFSDNDATLTNTAYVNRTLRCTRQVALRWIVQSGGSFTTQSKNKDHFSEDLKIFDFELTDEEMKTLNSLA